MSTECFIPKCSEGQVLIGIDEKGCPAGCVYPGDIHAIVDEPFLHTYIIPGERIKITGNVTGEACITPQQFQSEIKRFDGHIVWLWLVLIIIVAIDFIVFCRIKR